jgi:hypothetical protein
MTFERFASNSVQTVVNPWYRLCIASGAPMWLRPFSAETGGVAIGRAFRCGWFPVLVVGQKWSS